LREIYGSLSFYGVDADDPAVFFKLHDTGDGGEEGVVPATGDVGARVELRAALADEDGPCGDDLASKTLDAEALSRTVAAIDT